MTTTHLFASTAAAVLFAGPALAAPLNAPPPVGGTILVDMAQHRIARGDGNTPQVTIASARYVATSNQTRFTFALRADNSFFIDRNGQTVPLLGARLFLDNVFVERVNPITNVVLSGNLLTNGDFELGVDNNHLPFGWIFDQADPRQFQAGQVTPVTPIPSPPPLDGSPPLPNHSFTDDRNEAYDALSQTLPTIRGATYEVSFMVMFTDRNPPFSGIDVTDFQRLATLDNGGRQVADGLDAVLTATNVGPGTGQGQHVHFSIGDGAPVPEPATWAMVIAGLFGLRAMAWSRRQAAPRSITV